MSASMSASTRLCDLCSYPQERAVSVDALVWAVCSGGPCVSVCYECGAYL